MYTRQTTIRDVHTYQRGTLGGRVQAFNFCVNQSQHSVI